MSRADQAALSAYEVERTTETVTKTVICRLETSQRKNERVREVIDEWQAIAGRMADLMPSFGPAHWRTQDTTLYHAVQNEFPDHGLRAHDASQAAYKVGEAFGSWHSNRHGKARPSFGGGDYARFCHCGVAVEENDRGWGVKMGIRPRAPEWFHIVAGPYQRDHLEAVTDGSAETGSAELHLSDDGRLTCHLSVKREVPVYVADDVPTVVGVDLGETVLYAATVLTGDTVDAVRMERGREFRHHRDRLTGKRDERARNGDLRGVRACRDERAKYTEHVTHEASRAIVDLAREHAPAAIQMEALTGYRESAADPIHDWPFDQLQDKIRYKATEAGIPWRHVDPHGTSYTCSECGSATPENRAGVTFACRRCGYEVHADVNAAKNIARAPPRG